MDATPDASALGPTLADFVPLAELRNLLEGFAAATGLPARVVDVRGEPLLSVSGASDLCREIHPLAPSAAEVCQCTRERLREIRRSGRPDLAILPCGNGLVEATVPVILGDRIVAHLGTGQAFLEPPREESLRAFAAQLGVDPDVYVAAAGRVPVFDEARLRAALGFLGTLAALLAGHAEETRRRHETEARLARSERFFRALLEHSPDVVARFDRCHRHVYINGRVTDATGLLPNEVLGRTNEDLGLPPDHCAAWRKFLERTIETGRPQQHAFDFQAPDEHRYFQALSTPEFGPDGTVETVVVVARDLTELRRIEEELRDARVSAENTLHERSRILATMSHEIRTPLNGIAGFSELLLDFDLPEEAREYVESIRDASKTLVKIVSDILEFSRLETGRVELEQETFDPVDLAAECLDLVLAPARAQGIALAVVVGPRCPAQITTDRTRLRQILVNLVGNAVKFTTRGGVRVDLDGDGDDRLVLRVRDSGIGIRSEQREHLFEPFRQADASTSRRFGGTGLGLAISRDLAGLLGGTLECSSDFGHGSTFTLRLGGAEPDRSPFAAPVRAGKVRIDVANPFLRAALADQVRAWGAVPVHEEPAAVVLADASGAATPARSDQRVVRIGRCPETRPPFGCVPEPIHPRTLRAALGG